MTKFIDGPAAGVTLFLRRAPFFLRVVRAGGKWDALDQVEDEPGEHEEIFVYRLTKPPLAMHLNCRGKHRATGGWYHVGEYELHPNPPDDAIARDRNAWIEFSTLQAPAEFAVMEARHRQRVAANLAARAGNVGAEIPDSKSEIGDLDSQGLFGSLTAPPAAGLPDV